MTDTLPGGVTFVPIIGLLGVTVLWPIHGALCGALLASASHAQGLNPLPLHNGGDVLWFINAPWVGAPVDSFDPTGDLYWKVYPADALRQHCVVQRRKGNDLRAPGRQ